MTAKIRFPDGLEATVTGLQWSCSDAGVQEALQAITEEPWGYDPNPDATAALAAAEKLGGTLISFTPTEYVPGRVY